MELGSLLLLTSIVGIVGIGFAVAAKYLGITEALNTLIGFFQTFFSYIGDVISWSPRWIQIGLFMVVGLTLLGSVGNWMLASDSVCSEGVVYKSSSFISAMTAKFLPGDDETSIEEENAADSMIERTLQLVIYDPISQFPSFVRWGTFVASGGDVETIPDLPITMGDDLLMALPSYTTVENENLSEERHAFGSNASTFLLSKQANLRISKASIFTEAVTDKVAGRCYMDDVATISFLFGASGDDLGEIQYRITPATLNGRKVVSLNIKYLENFGDTNLNDCPQIGIPGEVLLRTGGSFQNEVGNQVTVANQSGWVSAKYFSIQELGIDPESLLEDSDVTKRSRFISEAGDEFSVYAPASEDVVTFVCEENDDVKVLVWGLDIFDVRTLVFMMALVGIFVVLSKLNFI